MIGFFKNHIQGFLIITTPITNLLAKEVLFIWESEQQQTFKKLRQIISIILILIHPDFNRLFILYIPVDALKEGLGVILTQEK